MSEADEIISGTAKRFNLAKATNLVRPFADKDLEEEVCS